MVVDEVEDDGQDAGLDFAHLQGRVLLADDLVEPSQAASEGGVEMVFYVIVGHNLRQNYLPLSCTDISFQRLPSSRCSSNSNNLFLIAPDLLVDRRVQVVVPSLAALFTGALDLLLPLLEPRGHRRPVVQTHFVHYFC